MAKIDHEKLNHRERGERAAAALADEIESNKPAAKEIKSKWLELQTGNYPGFTLPLLFDMDLPYFCQLMLDHFLEGPEAKTKIAKQGRDICNRACNMFPPGPYRESKEFLNVVDRDKIFERFIVVSAGAPLKERLTYGSCVVSRVKTLDFTEPYKHHEPEIGLRRMADCIRHTYGWSEAPNPVRKREVFFEYNNNANMAALVAYVRRVET